MRRISLSAIFAAAVLFLVAGKGNAAEPNLPLVAGKPTLALINDEPLTLEEFDVALAGLHEGVADNAATSRARASELLDRLINAKLILQEARNIGLDALPEVVDLVKVYEEDMLRGMLGGYRTQQVKKADAKEVEKRYRDAIREVKVASILMDKEEDGKRVEAEIRGGADFHEAARRMMDEGTATGSLEGRYLKFESFSPEVAKAVSAMKSGDVSPLVRVGNRFTILKLEGRRSLEDPAERKKAENDALQAKRAAVWNAYLEELKKKYVKVNRKLLASLDYESPDAGLEKLSTDRRVVAEVKGEKPVTVGDVTEILQRKFYHGAERAAAGKKINVRKEQVLEEILIRRITVKEAKRKGYDRSEFFKLRVSEYREGVLFGHFLQKVVDPEIHVEEAEGRTYYQEHIGKYTAPEMMRLEAIAFSVREDAEDAVQKLRQGADFQWMRANATGQVDPKKAGNLLEFGEILLLTAALPEEVRKAVSGAAEGDYRFFGATEGPFYVLHIREIEPPRPQPYEDVRTVIERNVFLEKRQKAFRDWEETLRRASEVKIFATGEKLDRIIGPKAR
jgi:parvulin-like peptidyl-prolyl isomerase